MKYSSLWKLFQRILSLPFVFGILFIAHNCFVLKRMWEYFKWGGEFAQYSKDDPATIKDIYDQLKNKP